MDLIEPEAQTRAVVIFGIGALLFAAYLAFMLPPFFAWSKVIKVKRHVRPAVFIRMRLQGVNPHRIADAFIRLKKAGVEVELDELVQLYKAGHSAFPSNIQSLEVGKKK